MLRCPWAGDDPLMQQYHDREWGRPVHDDRVHFELLTLEGAQAGLSWRTILRKRENYRRAFAGFDPLEVARYGEREVRRLLLDAGLVRLESKIRSVVDNARAFLALQREAGSFDAWLWPFVDGRPVVTRRRSLRDLPASTGLSDRISRDLKRRGFRFVGSTIVYAFLQAVGVVDDHLAGCPAGRRASS